MNQEKNIPIKTANKFTQLIRRYGIKSVITSTDNETYVTGKLIINPLLMKWWIFMDWLVKKGILK